MKLEDWIRMLTKSIEFVRIPTVMRACETSVSWVLLIVSARRCHGVGHELRQSGFFVWTVKYFANRHLSTSSILLASP